MYMKSPVPNRQLNADYIIKIFFCANKNADYDP